MTPETLTRITGFPHPRSSEFPTREPRRTTGETTSSCFSLEKGGVAATVGGQSGPIGPGNFDERPWGISMSGIAGYFCDRRSGSAPKEVDAACKIVFARLSSRFSWRSRRSSSRSLSGVAARLSFCFSAWLTQLRRDCEPTPSCRATRLITPWSLGSSRLRSRTILTARSFSSVGYRFCDGLFAMLHPLPRYGASTTPRPNHIFYLGLNNRTSWRRGRDLNPRTRITRSTH